MSHDEPPSPPAYGAAWAGAAPTYSGKAIAALVTGLVGLLTVCCLYLAVTSLAAIALGVVARRDIAASEGRLKGDGLALTGIITGAVGLVLLVVSIVLLATGVVDTHVEPNAG